MASWLICATPEAHAEPPGPAQVQDLVVGMRLEAIADVTLHRADLRTGSKVQVRRLQKEGGKLSAADLELADGHIVPRVAIRTIQSYFRALDSRAGG